MSQSQSLIAALEAVDRILSADTGDLLELARISGIPADRLYLRADLSGIDLRHQDIAFLIPLGVDYLGAELSDKQLRAFRSADRKSKKTDALDIEEERRLYLLDSFILDFINSGETIQSRDNDGRFLDAESLHDILFKPLSGRNLRSKNLQSTYINTVLDHMGMWVSKSRMPFFSKFFYLLCQLNCAVDEQTVSILQTSWRPILGEELGSLIAELQENIFIDTYWILRDEFTGTFDAAMQLGSVRPVHSRAIEEAFRYASKRGSWEWHNYIRFITEIHFDCDGDGAERLAVYITRSNWPATETPTVLNANTHNKVRTALFRQILAQGQQDRVVEVIKWLEDERGAAGALSLENAFNHIESFDLAYKLALELAPRMVETQLVAIDSSLSKLAYLENQESRLNAFRRRFDLR